MAVGECGETSVCVTDGLPSDGRRQRAALVARTRGRHDRERGRIGGGRGIGPRAAGESRCRVCSHRSLQAIARNAIIGVTCARAPCILLPFSALRCRCPSGSPTPERPRTGSAPTASSGRPARARHRGLRWRRRTHDRQHTNRGQHGGRVAMVHSVQRVVAPCARRCCPRAPHCRRRAYRWRGMGNSRSVPRRGDGDRRRGTATPPHPSPHMLPRGPPPRCLCPASLRLHPRRLDRHLGRSRLLRQAAHRLHADLTPVKKASMSGTRSTGIQTPRRTIPATTRGANDQGSNAHRSSRGEKPRAADRADRIGACEREHPVACHRQTARAPPGDATAQYPVGHPLTSSLHGTDGISGYSVYSSAFYTMFNLIKEIRDTTVTDLGTILHRKVAEMKETFETNDRLGLHQINRPQIHYLLARITQHIETQSGIERQTSKRVRISIGLSQRRSGALAASIERCKMRTMHDGKIIYANDEIE